MPDKRSNIVLRFGIVYFLILFAFILILYRIIVLQYIEKNEWMALAAKQKKTDIVVKPNRGNIFASDGRLMASSIPTYYVFMDTRVPALHDENGKLFTENIDSLALCLSRFFGDKTKNEYLLTLKKAYREGVGELKLFPKRISYSQLKEMKNFPLFRLGRNKSGLITKEQFRRVKPFGSLASRTIGDIYADEAKGGKNGLELFFNKELLGIPGVSIRQKVANRWEETIQVEPVDGLDVMTTIDIDLQDIAEKALVDSLQSFEAASGYVILMEVHSGEVKAIVNMQRNEDGTYSENKNGAVSDQVEPGSTFKVVSLMALIDEGKAKVTDTIHTGNGIYNYYGSNMTDHNANHGGFHDITLAEAIHGSSNIGISRAVVKAWGNNPAGFVDKIYAMKLNEKMNIEIPGAAGPKIRHPKYNSQTWSRTTLPWMSIGYETQIPPIYTLAFYNAIANDGKLIRPFFVKSVMKNGQVVKTFTTETINPQICKPTTLATVREVLLGVLEGEKGTAKNVRSKYFRIAGKTGTAQISKGAAGYKAGGKSHQVSFCGFFPYESPQYTCIVVIREPHKGYPSGGKMAGSVFKDVAEKTMALKSIRTPEYLTKDSTMTDPFLPAIKSGRNNESEKVLGMLGISFIGNKNEWGKPVTVDNQIKTEIIHVQKNEIPDLKGMGAKDAIYLLGELGLKVQISGRGKVISQNRTPGSNFRKGDLIVLTLN